MESTQSITASPSTLNGKTDVSEAIVLAARAIGINMGTEEDELVKRLRKNWVMTTDDLLKLSRDEASELLLPLRLRTTIQGLMKDSSSLEAPIPTPSPSVLPMVLPSSVDEAIAEPLEDQKCPKRYQKRGAGWKVKTTTRSKGSAYALTAEQISQTPQLASEFKSFERFCTTKFFGSQHDPVCQRTALNYSASMKGILGWMHKERSVPLVELSMKQAFPSKDRLGVSLAFDFMQWLSTERKVNPRTQSSVLQGLIMSSKFVWHADSNIRVNSGESAYSDLEVVSELRAMLRGLKSQVSLAPSATSIEKKWLSWAEYLQLVESLKSECGGRDAQGRRRSNAAIALSIQTYLIFAILSSVPDRQRTLRELKVGTTLIKDDKGRWLIKHQAADYKTGKAYGERPPLVISPSIFPLLEAWIDEWRQHLNPKHGFLFSRPNGEPFDASSLSRTFSLAAHRISGKRLTPHMVRDMIVTHLRSSDASEKELEALAIYMGHSIAMQRSTYDRRTKAEKVEPAVSLLHLTNLKASSCNGAKA
jgi:hypothetical protein